MIDLVNGETHVYFTLIKKIPISKNKIMEEAEKGKEEGTKGVTDGITEATEAKLPGEVEVSSESEVSAEENVPVQEPLQMRKRLDTQAKLKMRASTKSNVPQDPEAQEKAKEMDINEHMMELPEVCNKFSTDPQNGLSEGQISSIRDKYGYNELTPPEKTPAWIKFLKILFEGFSLLLWVGAIMCFIAYGIDKSANGDEASADNFYLGAVLVAVVVVTAVFTFYQEAKSEAIMESFQKMVPQDANVIRDGKAKSIPAREIVPGDIVLVEKGDRVPADILILEAASFKVDNSSLTGESEPVLKTANATDEGVFETENLAFFSTNAVEGTARGMAIRTGDTTAVGHIASLATATGNDETPIRKEIKHFIKIISTIAVLLGISFGIISLAIGYKAIEAVVFVIGIIVANVPEGLLATVTVALTLTAKKMAKKNCLVKNIEAVETLGSTSVICSDKTGTLTQNKMTVMHWWFNKKLIELNNTENEYGIDFDKEAKVWDKLALCCILCSKAEFKAEQEDKSIPHKDVLGDATEAGIFKMVCAIQSEKYVNNIRDTWPRVAEIPFNSANKFHVVIHETPQGINHLFMKGAPEKILACCTSYREDDKDKPMDKSFKKKFEHMYEKLGGLGERVLGFCDNELPKKKFPKGFKFVTESGEENFPTAENRFLGLVALVDPPKTAVPHAIELCRSAGITVMMVTGDHPLTAKAIAQQVGIISPDSKTPDDVAKEKQIPVENVDPEECKARVIHGQELKDMHESDLEAMVIQHPELVFARTTPEQKLKIVGANQKQGKIVGVTGDGVNDSPALKKADIGIAMGIAGSDVSKQAADMILLDDNFASIVNGVEEGRLIFDNLKKSIVYTLTSNIPELAPFLAFITAGIPLPLGTITILFIDLGTDMIPAISLAYEYPERDIMARQPRDPQKDRLVNARLIFLAYALIGVCQASAGFFIYFVIMAEHGWLPKDLVNLRKQWDSRDINDLEDSYGQEWSYEQRKKLEYTCHTAFFMSIVQVQWTDLIISKTRKVSIFEQGMRNRFLNFALCFETVLACFLIYLPYTNVALRLYALSPWYWFPALPFVAFIWIFDECRRIFIRKYPEGFVASVTYY